MIGSNNCMSATAMKNIVGCVRSYLSV